MQNPQLIMIPEVLESKRVFYRCTCDKFKTIHRLYFCRHCSELRCRDCVLHEVSSVICGFLELFIKNLLLFDSRLIHNIVRIALNTFHLWMLKCGRTSVHNVLNVRFVRVLLRANLIVRFLQLLPVVPPPLKLLKN